MRGPSGLFLFGSVEEKSEGEILLSSCPSSPCLRVEENDGFYDTPATPVDKLTSDNLAPVDT